MARDVRPLPGATSFLLALTCAFPIGCTSTRPPDLQGIPSEHGTLPVIRNALGRSWTGLWIALDAPLVVACTPYCFLWDVVLNFGSWLGSGHRSKFEAGGTRSLWEPVVGGVRGESGIWEAAWLPLGTATFALLQPLSSLLRGISLVRW